MGSKIVLMLSMHIYNIATFAFAALYYTLVYVFNVRLKIASTYSILAETGAVN